MRVKLASVLIVIGLLGSSMTPANAIFGLSKCEKMKKSINYEYSITLELWKNIKADLKKEDSPFSMSSNLGMRALDLNESFLRAYKLAKSNPSCFSVSTYAKILNMTNTYSRNVKGWKEYVSSPTIFQFGLFEAKQITQIEANCL